MPAYEQHLTFTQTLKLKAFKGEADLRQDQDFPGW